MKIQKSMKHVSEDGSIPAITGNIDYSLAVHIFPESLVPWRSTILAYGASFAGTTIGFPMDTVKTRMQTHKHFPSYWSCVTTTFKNEGVKGFFRGIWAPLLSTSFSKSLSVSIFTQVKPYCYNGLFHPISENTENIHPFIRNVFVCFISGNIAGAGVSVFACPFEFTKVYSQISTIVKGQIGEGSVKNDGGPANRAAALGGPSLNTGGLSPLTSLTLQTFKKILAHEGLGGLYSGYRYHLLRDLLSSGFYYSMYESMKWCTNGIINSSPDETSKVSILLAGGLSGIMSWITIFPIDTTKSLIQKDAVTNILRKEQGLPPLPLKHRKIVFQKRLYRGLGISISRSFLVNMVFFGVYELAMSHLV